MFASEVNFNSTFGCIMVIAEKTDVVVGFNIVNKFNQHSNSTIISFHLECNIAGEFDVHTFGLLLNIVNWDSIVMF